LGLVEGLESNSTLKFFSMEYYPSQHGLQFESEPGAYHGDANDELAKPSPNPRDSSSGLVTSVVGGGTCVFLEKGALQR